jgi:hypothetical protein
MDLDQNKTKVKNYVKVSSKVKLLWKIIINIIIVIQGSIFHYRLYLVCKRFAKEIQQHDVILSSECKIKVIENLFSLITTEIIVSTKWNFTLIGKAKYLLCNSYI